MSEVPNIVVAISGGGRSLKNLMTVGANTKMFRVVGVIASSPDCPGNQIAKDAGIPLFIDRFSLARLDEVGDALEAWLQKLEPQLIALAGFLRPFPVRSAWQNRVVNIHPALLPSFGGQGMYGDRVHAAVLEAREKFSGATIHFVNERYDDGQIIAQVKVPVQADDNVDKLAARVFAAECQLFPAAVNDLLSKTLPLASGEIKIYEF